MEIRTELVEEDEERGRELSYPVLRGGTGTALRRLVYRQIEDKTDCDCRQNSNTQQNQENGALLVLCGRVKASIKYVPPCHL